MLCDYALRSVRVATFTAHTVAVTYAVRGSLTPRLPVTRSTLRFHAAVPPLPLPVFYRYFTPTTRRSRLHVTRFYLFALRAVVTFTVRFAVLFVAAVVTVYVHALPGYRITCVTRCYVCLVVLPRCCYYYDVYPLYVRGFAHCRFCCHTFTPLPPLPFALLYGCWVYIALCVVALPAFVTALPFALRYVYERSVTATVSVTVVPFCFDSLRYATATLPLDCTCRLPFPTQVTGYVHYAHTYLYVHTLVVYVTVTARLVTFLPVTVVRPLPHYVVVNVCCTTTYPRCLVVLVCYILTVVTAILLTLLYYTVVFTAVTVTVYGCYTRFVTVTGCRLDCWLPRSVTYAPLHSTRARLPFGYAVYVHVCATTVVYRGFV